MAPVCDRISSVLHSRGPDPLENCQEARFGGPPAFSGRRMDVRCCVPPHSYAFPARVMSGSTLSLNFPTFDHGGHGQVLTRHSVN